MEPAQDVFNSKYTEFCYDLLGACPEMAEQITKAQALSPEERKKQFKEQVLQFCSPKRNAQVAPSCVLPGVPMSEEVWALLSAKSKKAIQEYLTILSFTCLLDTSSNTTDLSGTGWSADWAREIFNDMKSKMNNIDFSGFAEKIAKIFGEPGKDGIPKLPEKFMKGQIARLAEEIVKEFRMEDFGLDPAAVEAAGDDPTKALNLIMDVFMKNPQNLQKTIQRLGKRLQEKIQSGSIRPQDLVAEAEELMKTFSENPQFVEMMETFRQTFGMEDPDIARAAGKEESARLSLVKQRLRKKLEAKKAGKK